MSPAGSKNAPEAKAREKIDALLAQAGWLVQDRQDMNLTAGDGIAVREFKLEKGHGYVDYLLFVDGNALGVVEAKPAGYSFTSVEFQAKKYVEGADIDAGDCSAVHADANEATRELVHDDEYPIATQQDGLAAKKVDAPQAVGGVSDQRQPGRPVSA